MSSKNSDVDGFLAHYPPPVPKIAAALRRLIFVTLPNPIETLNSASRIIGYGFGVRYADTVCTLIPSKTGVKLGIAYGASLPDPEGLLGGAGKVHRHIDCKTMDDIRRPGVEALLLAALAAQRARAAAKNSSCAVEGPE